MRPRSLWLRVEMEFLEFSDPRQFVEIALKKTQPKPSIRKLAKNLGFASDRTIGMVLKGQRAMSQDVEARISKFLKLNVKEQLHFHTLALRARGLTTETSAKANRHHKASNKKIATEDLHPLVPWFSLAIVDLLWLKGKPLNSKEIRSQLRGDVALADVESALENLVSGGFLAKESGLHYRTLRDEEYVQTSSDIPSKTIRGIHQNQLERAAQALDSESVLDREITSKTLVVSKSKVESIKRLLREKLEEIAEEVALNEPQEDAAVAQLNLQFYLQTK